MGRGGRGGGRGRKRGRGYSVIACLSRFTVDYASISRWIAVSTSHRGTSNVDAGCGGRRGRGVVECRKWGGEEEGGGGSVGGVREG